MPFLAQFYNVILVTRKISFIESKIKSKMGEILEKEKKYIGKKFHI